jgi:hypothetical protein
MQVLQYRWDRTFSDNSNVMDSGRGGWPSKRWLQYPEQRGGNLAQEKSLAH